MKISSRIVLVLLSIAALSVVLKAFKVPHVDFFFTIDMFVMAVFFLGQVFLGKSMPLGSLKAFQRLNSFGLFLGCIAVLFRYMLWRGWKFENMGGLALFMPGLLLFVKMDDMKKEGGKIYKYFKFNHLYPSLFIILTSVVGLTLPEKTFYEMFSRHSLHKTYEQFQEEQLHPLPVKEREG